MKWVWGLGTNRYAYNRWRRSWSGCRISWISRKSSRFT
jgi:hypothetical protein